MAHLISPIVVRFDKLVTYSQQDVLLSVYHSVPLTSEILGVFKLVPASKLHPGEMLLEEFLSPMGISKKDLAENIEVPYQRINEIVNGRRGITPSAALRLAKFFDLSPDFWMNLQLRWDLYFARQDENKVLQRIQPYSTLV